MQKELEESLKWTNFSKIPTNLKGQGNNSKRGMSCVKIDSLYDPHNKYVSDADDLFCVHCARDGHLNRYCPMLKIVWRKFVKLFQTKE